MGYANEARNPHACTAAAGRPCRSSELHAAQLVEQGLGVELVAGLARVVRAKRQPAHASELLSRDLGVLLAIHLLPEVLIEPAAIHLGLRRRGSGHQAERNKADDRRPEHVFLRWMSEFGLETQQSLRCCGPAEVTRRFSIHCQGGARLTKPRGLG